MAAPHGPLPPWSEVDNDIPAALYTDPALYAAEMERVFQGPVWHLVAHLAELPRPGDYKTFTLGDLPLIVLRDPRGQPGVLLNSCAHRGAEIVHDPYGNLDDPETMLCIYHMWKYAPDGSVAAVSRRNGYDASFCPEAYGLPAARVAAYRGFVFASFHADTAPLEEYLGAEILRALDDMVGEGELRYLGAQRAIFACNWKLYVENLYDSYHAISLHKAFRMMRIVKPFDVLDRGHEVRWGHYLTEYFAQEPEKQFLRDMGLFEARGRDDHKHTILNIFPASPVSQQIDVLGYRAVIPRGPEQTEVQFHVFGRADDDPALLQHRLWHGANLLGPQGLVNLEDGTALARVQATIVGRKPLYSAAPRQRFPAYRDDERSVRYFYAAYRRLMADAPEAPPREAP